MTAESTVIKNTPASGPESRFVSRRHFIQLGAAAMGAAWLGMLVRAGINSSQAEGASGPVTFPLAELPVGGTKSFVYAGAPSIAIRTPESIRAFSLVCTHLGCTVLWQPGETEFFCPCHDGRFDQFGEVISGPPPLPLEQLPVTVEGETVIVGEV